MVVADVVEQVRYEWVSFVLGVYGEATATAAAAMVVALAAEYGIRLDQASTVRLSVAKNAEKILIDGHAAALGKEDVFAEEAAVIVKGFVPVDIRLKQYAVAVLAGQFFLEPGG